MQDYNSAITEDLPLLALRGLSVFPNMLLNFDVERVMSTGALEAASEGDRRIFLIAQKDITKESPSERDLYRIGTVCYIKQILRVPGGGTKVLVEGRHRARLISLRSEKGYFVSEVQPIPEEAMPARTPRTEALIRKCINLFDS